MSINYLDTVTMYYECPFDIRHLFTTHWIWDDTNSNVNLHHFCVKRPFIFIRFFPDMYGTRRLYATFSLPKLYRQRNDNTYHVPDYDNATFMQILYGELGMVLDTTQLPTVLADWQPSRIDLFRNRVINPLDRTEYLVGYSRRYYRGNRAVNYKNTNYLVANNNSKRHNMLEREYNKTVERQEKQSLLYGYLPAAVELEHEDLMHEIEIPPELFRYEFSLRRNAVIKYVTKYNRPLNMQTFMKEEFQQEVLNDLVVIRGLNRQILCKNDYRQAVKTIFKTEHSQQLALQLAESIRNQKTMPMSKSQCYRIKRELNNNLIDIATTNFKTIDGLDLLS